MSAGRALLAAIAQRLTADPALAAMIGLDGLRDRLLPRPQLPCIVLGELETRDASADAAPGEEHLLTLEIWSDGDGRKPGQMVADRVHALLHGADLALAQAVLVDLQVLSIRSRREPKTKFYLVEVKLRAVTE